MENSIYDSCQNFDAYENAIISEQPDEIHKESYEKALERIHELEEQVTLLQNHLKNAKKIIFKN